jgi:hypothetical protein
MEDDRAYCINGCGVPAVSEELYGVTDDGLEIVELVCYDCKNK